MLACRHLPLWWRHYLPEGLRANVRCKASSHVPRLRECVAGCLRELLVPHHPANADAAKALVAAGGMGSLVEVAQNTGVSGRHATRVRAGEALRALAQYPGDKGMALNKDILEMGYYGV